MSPLFPTQIPAAVRTSNPSSIERQGTRRAVGGGVKRFDWHAQKRQKLEKGPSDVVDA